MGAHHHDQKIPQGVLVAVAGMLLATLALAASARSSTNAEQAASPAVSSSLALRFEDRPDGSVAVLDAASSRQVGTVLPAEGGFVRGVMRGMFRTRKLESIPREDEFQLMRLTDGALVLEDPQTGRRVDLRSFGDTNYRAFAGLLAPQGTAP
ncbi:MAG: hypothetical protein IAG13_19200 [Deltaproteobacteria bacterium]|nr:hypothetical protein [Nannocystaceae bacterium]